MYTVNGSSICWCRSESGLVMPVAKKRHGCPTDATVSPTKTNPTPGTKHCPRGDRNACRLVLGVSAAP